MDAQQTGKNTVETGKLRDCLAIILVAAAPVLILRPLQNNPFIDDWVYAWPVEHLLKHGDLRILEYSGSINVAQILWGTLFCLPFGFSFTGLRVSTWVASVACLCGLYLTLRELDVSRRDSLIGTAALAMYPVYFVLSFTFMTDVPFLAAMVWSWFALVKAFRLRRDGWLVASVIFACLATAVRLVGAVLPVAMLCALLFHSDGWGRQKARWLHAIIPLVFLGLLLLWHSTHVEYSADLRGIAPAHKVAALKYGFQFLPQMLIVDLTFAAGTLGIATLPLIGGCLRKRHAIRAVVICALLGVALTVQTAMKLGYFWPLEPGSTWEINRLGANDSFLPGPDDVSWLPWIRWGLGIVTIAIILGSMTFGLLFRPRYERREAVLIWLILGQFILAAIIWLFYDRYALVFLPPSIALLLTGNRVVRPTMALTLISLFACVCLVGMRDHLEYNRSMWGAVDYLHRIGVGDSLIDAGYVVDGWHQYAHPENAPRDKDGKIYVPGMTTDETLRYRVSNSLLPEWKLLETIPYKRWLGPSGSIYVLECPESDERRGCGQRTR